MVAQVDGEPEEDAHEAVVNLPGSSDDGSEGGSNESFMLRNIDFSVKAGELLCVTGRVGSGKSSLVSTIACPLCLIPQPLGRPMNPDGPPGEPEMRMHKELFVCRLCWRTEESLHVVLRLRSPSGSCEAATAGAHPAKDVRAQVSAVLGDMERTAGTVRITGSIAYVAQSAWITNDTVQGNITFGKPFDQGRYDRVVEATSLEHDFKVPLPGRIWLVYR